MPLDRNKLDIVREENGWIYARCPACAERGEDKKKQHLVIFDTGAYHCIKNGHSKEHRDRMWQLAGIHNRKQVGAIPALPRFLASNRKEFKPLPKLPHLEPFYISDCRRLCLTRGWSEAVYPALFELSERGMLRFARLRDDDEREHSAWVVLDSSRRSAQAKKMHGKEWHQGKVKSLYGSWGNWTIGACDIGERPIVIVCEGMPDFVAALCIAYMERIPLGHIAPVCITGTSHLIHAEALPHFANKRVRIFAHPDEVGQESARRWHKQLLTVGAKVNRCTFKGFTRKDGAPVKDLADYLTLLDRETQAPIHVMRDLWLEVLSE